MKSSLNFAALFLVGSFMSSSCGPLPEDVAAPRKPAAGLSAATSSGPQDTFTAVEPIFQQFCSACHNMQLMTAGFDLTSYTSMTTAPGIIVPGNPAASILLQMLESGAMPPAGHPKPSAQQIADIHAWVAAGALNN